MTFAATRTLDVDTNIQYICTLVPGEALRQFDLMYPNVENIETLNMDFLY